jgi:ribulose-phosphate 3-epimerase
MVPARSALFGRLAKQSNVLPSLLQCDFGRLADELDSVKSLGIEAVHWDVMDGAFVPNISYGGVVIESVRLRSDLYFEAHLMIARPDERLDDFIAAGCDGITIHVEGRFNQRETLKRIKDVGITAGLCVNPETSPESMAPYFDVLDVALVMSVHPGFGGQKFLPEVLEKVRWLRRHGPPDLVIEIDGGINPHTASEAVAAGAQWLVVGSALFKAADRAAVLAELRKVVA